MVADLKRNRGVINRIVRGHLAKRKKGIVHGARAINAQLPRHLNKPTKDWDVFVRNPELSARILEFKLDRRFRGNVFDVKKGSSKVFNVRKVFSISDGETIVDFAQSKVPIPTKPIRGVKFATLAYHKGQIKRTLKDTTAKFRRAKDLDALKRIGKFEKLRGRKIK